MKEIVDLSLVYAKRFALGGLMVAILLASFASPALAATKVDEVKLQNFTQTIPLPLLATICGVTDAFTAEWFNNQLHIVVWSNGHTMVTSTDSISISDSDGNLIARDRFALSTIEGPGSLPLTVVLNLVARCTPASGNPGLLCNFAFGITIGEAGIIQVHGVEPPFSCFTAE